MFNAEWHLFETEVISLMSLGGRKGERRKHMLSKGCSGGEGVVNRRRGEIDRYRYADYIYDKMVDRLTNRLIELWVERMINN